MRAHWLRRFTLEEIRELASRQIVLRTLWTHQEVALSNGVRSGADPGGRRFEVDRGGPAACAIDVLPALGSPLGMPSPQSIQMLKIRRDSRDGAPLVARRPCAARWRNQAEFHAAMSRFLDYSAPG